MDTQCPWGRVLAARAAPAALEESFPSVAGCAGAGTVPRPSLLVLLKTVTPIRWLLVAEV